MYYVYLELAITKPLEHTLVAPRGHVILECSVNQQDVSSTWLKDGKPFLATIRHQIKVDGVKHSLVTAKCHWTDAGSYTVKLKKDDKELKSSCSLGITVYFELIITYM